jgi:hypothetical protein
MTDETVFRTAAGHPSDELAAMSESELAAELARVEDRLRQEAAVTGYRPSPGQMHRRAELQRREHQVAAELRRRQASDHPAPSHPGSDTASAEVDEADRLEQAQALPDDDEELYPHTT